MRTTANYGYKVIEGTDVIDVEDITKNFDTIDSDLKKVSDKANLIQTAKGTATAITLDNVTLVNGLIITFIVAANNNGTATTINGKALYKPGGTTAPTLTAGRAVTVWYNGSNFFIKASTEGNAAASDVLAGKTFSNDNDTGITGTMANRGAVTQALNAGGSYAIPEGYHNGSGKITANSLASQTEANAAASDLLSSKTAYVNGSKITGTMTNNGAVSQSLGINGSYTIPAGYHNGSGKVTQSITTKAAATYTPTTADQTIGSGQYLSGNQTIKGDTNLVSANIKAGITMFGVAGKSSVVETSDGTIAAGDVLSGKIGYANGAKISGTMTNNGAVAQSLAINGTYTIPAGYHNGSGKVTQSITTKAAETITPGTADKTIAAGLYLSGIQTIKGDSNLVAGNIKNGVSIFGVAGTYGGLTRSIATALSVARYKMAGANVGEYALIAGGYNGDTNYSTVDAYNSLLTRSTPTALSTARGFIAGANVGGYALFAGGYQLSTSTSYSTVDTYNSSLTKSTATSLSVARRDIAGVSIGGYALFAGGYHWSGDTKYSTVDAYNGSLTRSTPTALSVARSMAAGVSVGGYALITGGNNNDGDSKVVDAYNGSLTRSTPTALSVARYSAAVANVGEYALITGGYGGSAVDAYNNSLIKSTPTALSSSKTLTVGANLEAHALFAGGLSSSAVDAYNSSLIRSTATALSVARYEGVGISVGRYALIAGGSLKDTVDAYSLNL